MEQGLILHLVEKNMSVTFLNNYTSVNGGAVHGDDSTIVHRNNAP